ncbi:MAG: class I SAM-dependent methyltransferase [Deltaproteobacteria bacterium]|nr:class I SAM-dependent methyltransferase [Deltaproteobacteria bacterium]
MSEDARMRFEALYERQGSWDIQRPQPAFLRLAEQGMIRGTVLDVGCGTGDNALHMASLGHPTWGIDIVSGAIGRARSRAAERGLPFSRFLVGDVLELESLGMQFDTVIDSGLFHALCDQEREFFLQGLRRVLRPGGLYHMLGFSDRQPGDTGPRRLTEADLRATFCGVWKLVRLEPTLFETNIHPGGAQAWLATVEA